MGQLDGRVALVSGGGRGIGRGISLRLAAEGAAVAVNYRRDRDAAEETVATIEATGGSARAYAASVDDAEADATMVDAILADFGFVDVLVANAGIASRGRAVADTDPGEVDRLLQTHATSAHHLSRLVLASMRTRPRGDIVMISSVATAHMAPFGAPYNMAKAALEALAATLAKKERDHGIHVNIVAPGLVETDMGVRLARAFTGGGTLDGELWPALCGLADTARTAWKEPDQGIWEIRSPGRVFTYSAAMCQVAVDRAARVAQQLNLPGPIEEWRTASEALRHKVLEDAWDDDRQTLSEHLDGGGSLDASLLALPLRQVVEADDPRMIATTEAIATRLAAGDGLLYRYAHDESPDGIAGTDGAFLLCSFWLVDNLAKQGRLDEAGQLYEALCARANPLGLLPEQIDPSTGGFIGNFPQAFSHIGVISSGVNLNAAGA